MADSAGDGAGQIFTGEERECRSQIERIEVTWRLRLDRKKKEKGKLAGEPKSSELIRKPHDSPLGCKNAKMSQGQGRYRRRGIETLRGFLKQAAIGGDDRSNTWGQPAGWSRNERLREKRDLGHEKDRRQMCAAVKREARVTTKE